MASAETAANLYSSESPNRERLFLTSDSNLVVAGFGPATAGALLRIVKEMNLKGQIPPNITIIDRVNYFSQTSAERCSSCAGLITIQGLGRLAREFDPDGEVLRITDDKVIINSADIPRAQEVDVFPPSMERTLSEVRISEMAFHMGLDGIGYPTVHLPREHQMFASHRHGGPMRLQPTRNIGYTDALMVLLRHNLLKAGGKDVTFIQGDINQIQAGKHPKVILTDMDRKSVEVNGDLILIGTGAGEKGIKIKRTNAEKAEPIPRPAGLHAVLKEVRINPEDAKKHFGPNLQRAHVFISPAEVPAKKRDLYLGRTGEQPIQYAMLVPKKVIDKDGTEKVVVTIALISKPSDSFLLGKPVIDNYIKRYLLQYLPGYETSEDPTCDLCSCFSMVPSSALPPELTYDEGVFMLGAATGGLKFMKDGTGTGGQEGSIIGEMLVNVGYDRYALSGIADKAYGLFLEDNRIGMETLAWFRDVVIKNNLLRSISYLDLLIEQKLPYRFMHFLKFMEWLATGVTPYKDIANGLFGGIPGQAVRIFSGSIGVKTPRIN